MRGPSSHRSGEHDRAHRLDDHAGGGDDADVAALIVRRDLLARAQVGGRKRTGERRDRLQGDADDDVLEEVADDGQHGR